LIKLNRILFLENTINMSQIKVFITGANGQLGSELQSLAEQHMNISFLFTDIDTLDITDSNAVKSFFMNYRPDYVVNCAAYTAVDKAEVDEENAFRLNASAPAILASAADELGFKLIHISTDYVFNGRTWEPYCENDSPSPNSVYGKSKHNGEEEVLKSNNAMVIRTSWLYSVYGKNFVKTIASKANKSQELRVVFDQIGSPTWANDLAKAIVDIILLGKDKFKPNIFHYSNEGVCSWYDFALEIVSFYRLKCKIIPILSCEYLVAANRPPYSVLNKNKIKETFGLGIPHWKDSLLKCLSTLDIESLL